MKIETALRRLLVLCFALLAGPGIQAQEWKHASAYDKVLARNVLERSVFFLPLYGSVYRAKFEVMLKELPGIRGVIIHNHGCGGQ